MKSEEIFMYFIQFSRIKLFKLFEEGLSNIQIYLLNSGGMHDLIDMCFIPVAKTIRDSL